MNEDQILQLIESNDEWNRDWFLYQANDSDDIKQFFDENIVDLLDKPTIALTIHLGYSYEEAEYDIDHDTYLVLTNEQAEVRMYEYAEDMADDAEREIPEHLRSYFDKDKYIDDITEWENRGSTISHYNGEEDYEAINGTTYYIYRMH